MRYTANLAATIGILRLACIIAFTMFLSIEWDRAEAQGDARDDVRRGNAALQVGNKQEAVSFYSLAIDSGQLSQEELFSVLLGRAELLQQAGQTLLSIRDYDTAIGVKPRNRDVYNLRGEEYMALGRFDRARRDFETARELDLGHPRALKNLGRLALRRADFAEAIENFSAALKLDPGSTRTFYERGLARLGADDPRGAVDDFAAVLERDAGNVRAYASRGEANLRLGALAPALADFDKALALDPGFPTALLQRGLAYVAAGDSGRALADLSAAINISPRFQAAYEARAELFEAQNDTEAAVMDYRVARDLGSETAARRLGVLGKAE